MQIGKTEFDHREIVFSMWGDHFAVQCGGRRVFFNDDSLIDYFNSNSYAYEKRIDPKSLGLDSEKLIKIPHIVLKTRDVVRANRQSDKMRNLMKKLGDVFKDYGLIEFFVFGDNLYLFFEGERAQIEDKDLEKTEAGIVFPNPGIKAIPESAIPIPEHILEALKEIRAENESKRHFQKIGEKNGIEFILNDKSQLILRFNGKEAIADRIDIIYGKSAVGAEPLELGYPFLELPAEVEKEFKKVLGLKIPKGLKLKPAGISLLNGKEYFALSKEIPEEAFERVKMCFEDFGQEKGANLKGWLTADPMKVAEILNLN